MELLEFLRSHEEAFRSRARLASLYSDFRNQRQTNPDGYQANASTWLRALTAAAKAGLIPSQSGSHDRFTLRTGEELAKALQTSELGRPLALGSVLEDALSRKELVPLQEFLDAKHSIYAKSRIPTPWQVMQWSLKQLGVIAGEAAEDRLVTGNFVIMANVEAAAKSVLDKVSQSAPSYTSRIFPQDLFASLVADAIGFSTLSLTDASVLKTHLSRDSSALCFSSRTGTVRFKAPSESLPMSITQEDETVASLRSLMSSLEPQITTITNQISDLDARAREAVANKQLAIARSALRSKKLAETKLAQRTATYIQVEDVHAKIELAADQVELVKIMEASSKTLRSLNEQTGGVERVQAVREGLDERMINADEIQQALNDTSFGAVNEGEVDFELRELEEVERQRVGDADKARKAEAEELRRAGEEAEAELTRTRLAALDNVPRMVAGEENVAQTAGTSIEESKEAA